MNDRLITYKINLHTLTPVAIGSDKGDVLSPYMDYVFSDDGRSLHYLDLPKIEQAVMDNGLLDEYIRQIRTLDNNRSDFTLKPFLTARFGRDLSPFVTATVRQYGLRSTDKININPAVKNAGQPYLPGSSLKGALRTAMLYDWLVNTQLGESVLNRNVQKIKELDYINQQLFDLRLNRDRSNWSKLKDIEKESRIVTAQIFNEDDLFGPLQKKNDKNYPGSDARHIRVSDSPPLSPDAVAVYNLQRIRITPPPTLQRRGAAIPQVLEAITPGQVLPVEISVLPDFHNSRVLDYWKSGKPEDIFKLLGSFGKACIDNEIYELRDALDSSETTLPFEAEMQKLIELYEGMAARAEAGAIFLRLGFGKTVNDNSLLLTLLYGLQDEAAAWRQYRKAFFKVRRDNAFFPVTRTLTPDGMPMGWVKVKFGG